MEIIPSLNCPDLDCVNRHLRVAERFAAWIHLDVADGRFTFHRTWGVPELWPRLKSGLALEVHLMAEDPVPRAAAWLAAGAKRIIVHVETADEDGLETIRSRANKIGAEVMLAFSPETRLENVRVPLASYGAFQVLAVYPGLSDQKFMPLTLEKVSFLRKHFSDAIIEVDGGINPKTGDLAARAGARILVSEHYLFHHEEPLRAFRELSAIRP